MVDCSTNINRRNNHLAFRVIQHKKEHNIWLWKSRFLIRQNLVQLNCLMGSNPSPLIMGSPATIQQQICFNSKKTTDNYLMNDKINMDSTLVILVVSEWLLFIANSSMFQLYHGENKLIFNEMMTRSTLFQTNNMLSWNFIVLAHWSNSPRVDMSPHSDTLSWFRANQSLLLLLNAACLAEKQHMPML